VVFLDAQLGYAHRGVERAVEGTFAADAARRVARICGGCSAARSYAYAQALEAIARFETCGEIELARLVLVELERIYNHLADLAASAAGAGWGAGFTRGMGLKEEAMRLCRLASGHRLLFDAIVPGGVGTGILDERRLIGDEVKKLETRSGRYAGALFGNASLVSRWNGTGSLTHETVRAFGAVGPAHRASRGKIDVRAFVPYGAYRHLPICVAHAAGGDAFARCAVKRDELMESFRLIREALAQLGNGSLPPSVPLEISSGAAVGTVEGPRGAETVAVHVTAEDRIERLHVISASYRNWPLVARAMDGNIVPDFPLVNKSFNLCYACADR
jgi:Ni,Fe-hydrogenase III large subunit